MVWEVVGLVWCANLYGDREHIALTGDTETGQRPETRSSTTENRLTARSMVPYYTGRPAAGLLKIQKEKEKETGQQPGALCSDERVNRVCLAACCFECRVTYGHPTLPPQHAAG